MSLLDIFYSFTGGKAKVPGKRDQLRKFRTTVEEMKWLEPSQALMPTNGQQKNLSNPEEIIYIGLTSIKEIFGIVENKMRIYGMDSPKDFSCWRIMKPDRDDYMIGITKEGFKSLERLGVKLPVQQKH